MELIEYQSQYQSQLQYQNQHQSQYRSQPQPTPTTTPRTTPISDGELLSVVTRRTAPDTLNVFRKYTSGTQTENEGIVVVFQDRSTLADGVVGDIAELDCLHNGHICTASIPDGTVHILAAYLYDIAGYRANDGNRITSTKLQPWYSNFISENGYTPYADVECGEDAKYFYSVLGGGANLDSKRIEACRLFNSRGINTDNGITFELKNIRKKLVPDSSTDEAPTNTGATDTSTNTGSTDTTEHTETTETPENTGAGQVSNNGNIYRTPKKVVKTTKPKPKVVTTPNLKVPPSVPANLTATQVDNSIRLNWRNCFQTPNNTVSQYSVSMERGQTITGYILYLQSLCIPRIL